MSENIYRRILLFLTFLLSVFGEDTEVTCVFRESCLLPCQFQDRHQLLIHWIKVSDGDPVVHSYYGDKDQFEYQVQNFKNRTSLFKDQISKENASLLLTGVTFEDVGRYKCYTSTDRGNKESFVNLKTEAPVSKVIIYEEGSQIICSSEGIYPQPELSWSTIPPSNTPLNVTTTVQQTEDQLYSIRSSLVLEDDPDVTYSCTVRTQRNNMTSTYRKPGDPKGENKDFCLLQFQIFLSHLPWSEVY
uniref:Ig-like domain-containing protein n=1 Tax=Cyprinodon variegatus TaxID=28743 RepID=A0A3Q2C769_CYPVA